MIEHKTALFTALRQGATVLTPNNRLSQQLLQDYAKQTTTAVLDKPRCLPYQAFLHGLFAEVRHQHATTHHPLVLTTWQQRHLWQQILTQHTEYPCNDGLLHAVQEAWARCQLWQIDAMHTDFAITPQTRQFQHWQQQFLQQLCERAAMCTEQLVPYLLPYLETLNLPSLIWMCFDDYTPQQRALQQRLDSLGCQQQFYDLTPTATATYHFAADDKQDEYLVMSEWLKARLKAGEQRICVVIPDLQAQAKSLQRFLQRHFAPEHFNISLGKALSDYPLVAHALQWLQLDHTLLTNLQARLLLHSPYLASGKNEWIARAQCMQKSIALQEMQIPMQRFIQECAPTAPLLAHHLTTLTHYPSLASPSEWVNLFKTRLMTLGFPGDTAHNSASYQCLQRFLTLCDELRQLTLITPIMSQEQALQALLDAARTTIFQARKPSTPIQILGLLEASGCDFDSVWVSGLTDQCLPQKTQFSAFIPIELQRTHQMPHAIAARELQFAQQLLQRLSNGSRHSVFSYPRFIGDMPHLPSPLIIDLPALPFVKNEPATAPILLTPYVETYTVPLTATETVVGGTQALANQAKCPFRGFAAHRLHALPPPEISAGLDASERGQVVHRVMEHVWQHLGHQQQLCALSFEQLQPYIDKAIRHALPPLIEKRSFSFPPLMQDVEYARLTRLVNACLEWERQRPAFEVEALEQTFTLTLAGIEFRVRIDRLDKQIERDKSTALPTKKWVIDYKTSIPAYKPWNDERPEAPQLLLYALLDAEINALVFVQLKAGHVTCSGFSEDTIPIKGITAIKKNESWPAYQQQWHQQLTALAEELSHGYAPPQPTRASTCTSCEFQNLCRIEI